MRDSLLGWAELNGRDFLCTVAAFFTGLVRAFADDGVERTGAAETCRRISVGRLKEINNYFK